jgi:hypothetical protein
LHSAHIVFARVAGSPSAKAHVHRRLGVVFAAKRLVECLIAQDCAVENPLDAVLCPVDGVVVEFALGLGEDGVVVAAVADGAVALQKCQYAFNFGIGELIGWYVPCRSNW